MCKNNNSDPPVTVKVINDSIKFSKILSWKKNLSQIRSELEENNSIIDMELSLFVKISTSKDEGERLEVIDRDDENKRTLKEIIDTKKKVLYLQKYPWENFNEDHKLEHGYTINNNVLIKANKKAFTITNCEIKKIGEKRTKVNPKTKKKDFIEYLKVSLSFELEPTEEFIIRVEKALKSDDKLQKLREIVKDYGEFISEEIILGGRIYFKNSSKNKYKLFVGGEKRNYSSFNENDWSNHLNNLKNLHCIKLIKPISIFQLLPDELRKGVLSSIGVKIIYTYTEDYKYDLKESRKHVKNIPQDVLTIFQNEDSKCEIFVAVIDVKEKDFFNCRISHQDGEDPKLIIHCIQKKFKIRECKLKIRWMIIGYDTINFGLNSSDFDVQLEKFDVQNCRDHIYKRFLELKSDPSVLCFGMPKLRKLDRTNESLTVGHHFFHDQKSKKIGLCTFSYCLKQKRNIKLPEFTFYIFVIKCNNKSYNYGMLPFKKKISNWPKISINQKPKFISIYSSGVNKCSPVFLKQKINGIKIKYLKCNNENNISQPKLHELDNLQHAYFQANHDGNNWVDIFY